MLSLMLLQKPLNQKKKKKTAKIYCLYYAKLNIFMQTKFFEIQKFRFCKIFSLHSGVDQCSSNFFHRDPFCTAKFFCDP